MDYQLEVKQIVDYPRCRIYREFLRSLMEDRDIRTNGSSYLFYYMTLCSYANFRSSYRRIEGISYLVGPGEWICRTSELAEWFRTRLQHQALSILDREGCVSRQSPSVSKPHMKEVVQQVAQILAAQGVPCCECSKTLYNVIKAKQSLAFLSDCNETNLRYSLEVVCPDGKLPYRFELTLSPIPSPEDTPAHMQDGYSHKATENEEGK